MKGEADILAYFPIDTSLKKKVHSALHSWSWSLQSTHNLLKSKFIKDRPSSLHLNKIFWVVYTGWLLWLVPPKKVLKIAKVNLYFPFIWFCHLQHFFGVPANQHVVAHIWFCSVEQNLLLIFVGIPVRSFVGGMTQVTREWMIQCEERWGAPFWKGGGAKQLCFSNVTLHSTALDIAQYSFVAGK